MKPNRPCHLYYAYLKQDPSKNYVGVSVNFKSRKRHHIAAARRGDHYHFHRALMKYGVENFEWFIIATFSSEAYARTMERFARKVFKMGTTNMTDGGEGREGYVVSEETRKKIGDGNRGKKRTPEQIEVIRQSRLGTTLSEETRAKLSAAHKGKTLTEEHRRKISESSIGKVMSEEARRKVSEANRQRIVSDDTRRKISEINTGRVCSEETRAKIGAANRGHRHTEETRLQMSESAKRRVAREIAAGIRPEDRFNKSSEKPGFDSNQ